MGDQPDTRTSYRSAKPRADSGSDLESDEDTPLWQQKQEKYFRKNKDQAMAMESSSSEVHSEAARKQQKRKNNVWGSVLTEQDLTQTLVQSAGMESKESSDFVTRDVESYNFTNRYKDNRPDPDDADKPEESTLMTEPVPTIPPITNRVRSIIGYDDTLDGRNKGANKQEPKRSRKRKAEEDRPMKTGGVFDRLGAKKTATTRLGDIDIGEEMEDEVVVKKIAEFLHEPKIELIEKVVTILGKAVGIRILLATKDVEEGGGMYTLDGSRRRTPGGVYIQLLKQQPEFTPDVNKIIFKEDIEHWNKHKNEIRNKRRKLKKQKKQQTKQQKENNDSSKSDQSRSRSSSISRSRSPKVNDQEDGEIMDDDDDDGEDDINDETEEKGQAGNKNNSNRGKSSRNSRRRHRRGYNDYDKQVSGDNASDDDDDSNDSVGARGKSKPMSFEEELAAMKKQIELKKSQEAKKMEEDKEEKMKSVEVDELEMEESNVVDVLLE